ncbi:MAG: hypothetical protein Kow00104_02530 [Rhodothalassiaceae bacterium]
MNALKILGLCALTISAAVPTASYAADPIVLAANLGGQLGKAIYCGFDTDEFTRLAGRAIDSNTTNENRGAALLQFAITAEMATKSGPVGESCREFNKGFQGTIRILREAGF